MSEYDDNAIFVCAETFMGHAFSRKQNERKEKIQSHILLSVTDGTPINPWRLQS